MSENIRITHNARVTTVCIVRPEKKNAITQAMYAAMADAINTYNETDETRALIITGEGDMFTAGNDLTDFAADSRSDSVPGVTRFLQAIKDCQKPLIAAVNGPGIGIGLTMLLHCDLVYAGERATLSAPFVKLGLVPEAASSLLLPAAVGMAVANDIFMTGRTLTAEEAHAYGLISRIFPDSDLQDEVQKIARQVAHSAPNAMKHSKTLIRHQQARIAEQMATEGKLFVEQLKSPDFAESVAAMREKRTPEYS